MKKPWLNFYDKEVHASMKYPHLLIPQMLENTAVQFPHRKALVFLGHTTTYRELQEAIVKFSSALYLMNIQPRDRIILFMPNCPQMVIAFYAALRIGAIVVPANPMYTEKELEFQINDSGAETLITLDILFKKVSTLRLRTSIKRIIVGRIQDYLPPFKRFLYPIIGGKGMESVSIEEKNGVFLFQTLLQKKMAEPSMPPFIPDEIAILQYTSGTTGTSKGAMLSHRNIVNNLMQMRQWYFTLHEGGETFVAVLPFFHSYGMAVGMNLPLSIGATLIVLPRFVPKDLLKTIQNYRATIFPGVPSIYAALNNQKGIKFDISTIRYCISGAAPLSIPVLKDFERLTGGILIEGYGLTETSPVTHCNPLQGKRKIGSIGLPLPDTDCKMIDPRTGNELPLGEEGELCIKGPQVMRGYWQKPEETARALKDGWLLTGDIARMDEEGYFYIVDRKKDLIISEGFNIFPGEIDEFLMAHPKINEASAVGVPDVLRGEKIFAFVVLKKGERATQEEILKYCRDHLVKYKIPKKIIFKEELPKNLMGKILRRILREEASRYNS